MEAQLSLFIPALTPALDSNGNPISGATWNFYRTGTSSPESVYADFELETELGAVVTANSSGKFVPIYLDPTVTYRAVLEDEDSSTIDDIDPYNTGTGTAGQTVDITDFGIVAGDDDALAESNSDAVDGLLAFLLANNPTPASGGNPAIRVTAPAGHFRFAEPWVVKCALWLEGQSNSQRAGYATTFDFDLGGFEFHGPWTDHDGILGAATTTASGWRLENIACNSRAAAGTGHHGLHAVIRGDVIRCTFNAFPGDGIRIESITGFGASSGLHPNNANSARILFCQCGGNGGNGIHLLNGDANVISTYGCDVYSNGGFGIYDDAFLSNSHIGHHSAGNGLGFIYEGHKMGAVGAACAVPWPAWVTGTAYAVVNPGGQYRTNASKLYLLQKAGAGNTANAPTHTDTDGVTEADGYKWAYAGTSLYCWYHTAIGQTVAASTTTPGTNQAVWVPFYFGTGPIDGIPLWVSGMTWKNGGSYGGNSAVADSVWEACYGEDGQPPAQVRSPQLSIGGQAAVSQWSASAQIKGRNGAILNPGGFLAEKRYYNGEFLTAKFGGDLGAGGWLTLSHPTLHPDAFYGNQDVDTKFELGVSGAFITFTGTNTAFTGGRSTAQAGKVVVSEIFLGTGAAARSISRAAAAPTSGYHAVGEIVYNTVPVAGGKIGWVCVTAGEPGVWNLYGAIDP
jgi:hypothetical protein